MVIQRRTFLAALAAVPLVKDIKNPTEAQLAGMSEEEFNGAADPAMVECSICSTDFSPTDEQIVIGASARLIVACPQCRVVQMVPDPEAT